MDFLEYTSTHPDILSPNAHAKPIALRSNPPSPRLTPSPSSSLFVLTGNLSPTIDESSANSNEYTFSPTESARRRRPRETPMITLTAPKYNQVFLWTPPRGGKAKAVGWAECGDPDGVPCFFVGGHGCSRLVAVMFDSMARRWGVRLIWPERPGYGLSEDCNIQEYEVSDFAALIISLADHLKIPRFAMIGQSVGAVFTLSTAYKYPSRLLPPIYLISPWVSTYITNTYRWARPLPASLVTGALNVAMDIMLGLDRMMNFSMDGIGKSPLANISMETSMANSMKAHAAYGSRNAGYDDDDDDDDEKSDIENGNPSDIFQSTDAYIIPERPLRHIVKPSNTARLNLFMAMNDLRMKEPAQSGQILDVLIALEKYHTFGFTYENISVPIRCIWGDKDTLIPRVAMEWLYQVVGKSSSSGGVDIKVVEGEDHTLVWKEGVVEWAVRGISELYRGVVGEGVEKEKVKKKKEEIGLEVDFMGEKIKF